MFFTPKVFYLKLVQKPIVKPILMNGFKIISQRNYHLTHIPAMVKPIHRTIDCIVSKFYIITTIYNYNYTSYSKPLYYPMYGCIHYLPFDRLN